MSKRKFDSLGNAPPYEVFVPEVFVPEVFVPEVFVPGRLGMGVFVPGRLGMIVFVPGRLGMIVFVPSSVPRKERNKLNVYSVFNAKT